MDSRLTRKQRKQLQQMPGVEITSSTEVEIYIAGDVEGLADREKTEALMHEVSEMLGWGGFKTGYDGWVLRAGYESDPFDFNDRAARCHY